MFQMKEMHKGIFRINDTKWEVGPTRTDKTVKSRFIFITIQRN